jgi:Na+/H+ antiporter NhaD/arsenite permease-like protein
MINGVVYQPNPWMILPFFLWLGVVALAPHFAPSAWARHYGKLAILFCALPLGVYLFALPPIARQTVGHTLEDYVGFIALIGSLYIVSGGIHLAVRGGTSAWQNVCFLALGGLAANVLGTTGASMLLIRPWLQLNHTRAAAHHVVFFIFMVANVGGGLTPIGDPPLLIGYLKGVPFWWVLVHGWVPWIMASGVLLAVFYIIDVRATARRPAAPAHESISGGWLNLLFLAVIVGAVFISHPPFLREGLMLAAAAGSYFITPERIHQANRFSFAPILEVAVVFLAIFVTMMPALDWLQYNAARVLGPQPTPALVYWVSGSLSSILDSAPAYLAFVTALAGLFGGMDSLPTHAGQHLLGLSLGTVFFGAATYVGNGPNLMVKALAEKAGVPVPSFPGYIVKWALPILLPTLVLIWIFFLR